MKKYIMIMMVATLVFTVGCTAKKEIVDVGGTEVTVIDDSNDDEIKFESIDKIEDMTVIAWLSDYEAIVTVPSDIDTFQYDMGKDPIWKTMKFNYNTGEKQEFGPSNLYVYPEFFIKPSNDSNYLFVDGFKLDEKNKTSQRVLLVLDKEGNEIANLEMSSDGAYNFEHHWIDGNLVGYIHGDTTLEYIDLSNPSSPVFSKKLVKDKSEYSSDEEFYPNALRKAVKIGDRIIYSTSLGSYVLDLSTNEAEMISSKMVNNIYGIDDSTVLISKIGEDENNEEALLLLNLATKEEKIIESGGMPVVLSLSSNKRYIAYETYGNNGDPGLKIYDIKSGKITKLPLENCSIAMNSDLSVISGSKMDPESNIFKYFTVIMARDK